MGKRYRFYVSRRIFCRLTAFAPLCAALPKCWASAQIVETPPPSPETNADLPAETLYAIGVRMLREGRTYEKAAEAFVLAAQKDPGNPAHPIGVGCAYASRAASLCYAFRFSQMLRQEQADYPKKLQKWEAGRESFEKEKAADPEGMGTMNYDDGKPKIPPPRDFSTKDDNAPFALTPAQTSVRVSGLCQKARQAWKVGIGLCKTPQEKAEALYVQGWGLRILHDYAVFLAEENPSNPFADDSSDSDDGSGGDRATKPTPEKTLPFVPTLADAIAAEKEAIRLAPENALYQQALGDFLWDTNKKEALAAYEAAVALAPKNPNLLYLLYQDALEKELPQFNRADPEGKEKPATEPFAVSLGYLHQAQARDKANAWPLYEEAALLFRRAPYSTVGPSGNPDATPQEKQAALNAVQNQEARQRGKQAVDQIVRGNGSPRYTVPRYKDTVPRLLAQAWDMNSIRFLSAPDFLSSSRLRELARSVVGYGQVIARHENNLPQALRAHRAAVGMGYRLIGDWSMDNDIRKGKSISVPLVGIAVCFIGYKFLVQTYQEANDKAGTVSAQKESEAFQTRVADYKKAVAAQIKDDSIYNYY